MISDWEGIDRITSPPHANYSYSVQAGVSAGIDMVSLFKFILAQSVPESFIKMTYAISFGDMAFGHFFGQIMVPNNFMEFIDILTDQVNKNIIPMSRIDDAVARILRVKFIMGLFENPLADLSFSDQLGNQVHLFRT